MSTAGYLSHCKQIVELTGGVASKKRRTAMSNIECFPKDEDLWNSVFFILLEMEGWFWFH